MSKYDLELLVLIELANLLPMFAKKLLNSFAISFGLLICTLST